MKASSVRVREGASATAAYGIFAGLWVYLTKEDLAFARPWPLTAVLVVLGLLTGIMVRRAWVFLAVLGPAAVLAVLEVSGFVGSGDWAGEPLLSPPGVFTLLSIGALLLLGWVLGEGVDWIRGYRGDQRDDWP